MSILLSSFFFLACPTPPEQQAENRSLNNGPNGQNKSQPNNQPNNQNLPNNLPPENQGNNQGNNQVENNGVENGEPPPAKNPTDPTPDPIITQANPEQEKPEMVKDSILIRVERIPPKPIKPKHMQEDIARGEHAVFTGEIKCNKCEDEALLIRVVPFLGPDDQQFDHSLITHKKVEVGAFTLAVPKSDKPVVLELLIDKDKNDAPSGGEYFAVVDMGGSLIPTKNHSDLVLDGTKRDFFEAPPSPGTKAAE